MRKFILLFPLLILGTFLISGCTIRECNSNDDCVPAQCCHATSCVPRSQAPDCSDVVCTQECQPGTIDCGAGSCGCVNSTCQVIWNE
jgi:hypothetical protein